MRCQRVRLRGFLKIRVMLSIHRLNDITANCLTEFRAHYNCLEQYNHQLWQCRRPERVLNRCVFEKIVRKKICFVIIANSWTGSGKENTRRTKERNTSTHEGLADFCRSSTSPDARRSRCWCSKVDRATDADASGWRSGCDHTFIVYMVLRRLLYKQAE